MLYYFVNRLTKLFFNECKNWTADHKANNLLATDADGRILVSICNWDPEEDGLLDYDDIEKFMRYLDKYVQHNINGDLLKKWKGQNRSKTLIHRLKPGDLAYMMLIYEAKLGVWAQGMLGLGEENAPPSRSTTRAGTSQSSVMPGMTLGASTSRRW